jgi:hypothetical protein
MIKPEHLSRHFSVTTDSLLRLVTEYDAAIGRTPSPKPLAPARTFSSRQFSLNHCASSSSLSPHSTASSPCYQTSVRDKVSTSQTKIVSIITFPALVLQSTPASCCTSGHHSPHQTLTVLLAYHLYSRQCPIRTSEDHLILKVSCFCLLHPSLALLHPRHTHHLSEAPRATTRSNLASHTCRSTRDDCPSSSGISSHTLRVTDTVSLSVNIHHRTLSHGVFIQIQRDSGDGLCLF